MSENSKYEGYKKRLQGICDENNLVAIFKYNKYPITLTIKPLSDLYDQMSMLENIEENGYTSPDAAIVFTFKDGLLTYKTSQTFTIRDELFSKIKNLFKNMHYTWLQFFFREVVERSLLTRHQMPRIDDENNDSMENAEPLESFDDDEIPDIDYPDDGADYEDDGEPLTTESPLVLKATKIVRHENKADIDLLQRNLGITDSRAGEVLSILETLGIIGPLEKNGVHEILPSDEPDDEIMEDEYDNAET